jgi:hypothetical protein
MLSTAPSERRLVVVELESGTTPADQQVLGATVTLFGPADPVDVAIVLRGVSDPEQAQADVLLAACRSLAGPDRALPDLSLLGVGEVAGLTADVKVTAGDDVETATTAVAALRALSESLKAAAPVPRTRLSLRAPGAAAARPATDPAATPSAAAPVAAPVPATAPAPAQVGAGGGPDLGGLREVQRLQVQLQRASLSGAVAMHDLRRSAAGQDPRPLVVVVVQHQSYWGAAETVCEALRARDDVRLELVAIDSEHDGQDGSTAAYLTKLGFAPRDVAWLAAGLSDIDVVVHLDPYDGLRPEAARTAALMEVGVRVVYVPYANNPVAGETAEKMQYDLPLHRLAWRVYAGSAGQQALYGEHCAGGTSHVRMLGSPKQDRTVGREVLPAATALRRKLGRRTVFLWNPHFRFAPEGWSTFGQYVEPLIDHVLRHPQQALVLRPHFRLLAALREEGGESARFEQFLRKLAKRTPNLVLDTTPDYKVAFSVADALLSDASSLVPEFMPSGKPALYLRNHEGPGLNSDAAYFNDLYVADDWTQVRSFLDSVVRGSDPMAERRRCSVARHFGVVDGRTGARIVEDVLSSLAAERRGAAPTT